MQKEEIKGTDWLDYKYEKGRAFYTKILDDRPMCKIYCKCKNEYRYVYKVMDGSQYFILKSIRILKTSAEKAKAKVDQAKIEYDLNTKMCARTSATPKPLKFDKCEVSIEDDKHQFHQYIIVEMLYEYCGEDLNVLFSQKLSAQKFIQIVKNSLIPLEALEKEKIFHCDIKPGNFVMSSNEKIFLIDYGMAIYFSKTTDYQKTLTAHKKIQGLTKIFSPPELVNYLKLIHAHQIEEAKNFKIYPEKVDIYSWGMTMYSILTRKDSATLDIEFEKYKTDGSHYHEFLEKVRDSRMFQTTSNEPEIECFKSILLLTLDYNPVTRQTFETIKKKIDNHFDNCGWLKSRFSKVSRPIIPDDSLNKPEKLKPEGKKEINIICDNTKECEDSILFDAVLDPVRMKERIDLLLFQIKNLEKKLKLEVLRSIFMDEKNGKKVELNDTPLNDEEIELIALCMKLTHHVQTVALCGCQIKKEGARLIAKALMNHPSITVLNLSSNKYTFNSIETDGAFYIADALKENKVLEELWLINNNIKQKGCAKLILEADMNAKLKFMDISKNENYAAIGGIRHRSTLKVL